MLWLRENILLSEQKVMNNREVNFSWNSNYEWKILSEMVHRFGNRWLRWTGDITPWELPWNRTNFSRELWYKCILYKHWLSFVCLNDDGRPCCNTTKYIISYLIVLPMQMYKIIKLGTHKMPVVEYKSDFQPQKDLTDHLLVSLWALQWCHNKHSGISNHQPYDCLLNHLFRRRSKRILKLRFTGLCAGNSPVPGEFPAQRARNAENVSIWWRHHVFMRIFTTL